MSFKYFFLGLSAAVGVGVDAQPHGSKSAMSSSVSLAESLPSPSLAESAEVYETEVLTCFPDQPKGDPSHLSSKAQQKIPKGGSLTLACPKFDTVHIFHTESVKAMGCELMHATLFHDNGGGDVLYPYVACRARIEPDRIIFFIHPQARFQDGTPIKGADVCGSFQVSQKSALFRLCYKNVQEAKVDPSDDLKVIFLLKPHAPKETSALLGQLPIVHKTTYLKDGAGERMKPPIGSGPYRLVKVVPGQRVEYQRVQDFWGKDLPALKGLYNFDRVCYTVFQEDSTIMEALKKGEIDAKVETVIKNWHLAYEGLEAVKEGKLVKKSFPFPGLGGDRGIIFNTRNPVLMDQRVRLALCWLFPFEEINRVIGYHHYHRFSSLFHNSPCQAKGKASSAEHHWARQCLEKEYEKIKAILDTDIDFWTYGEKTWSGEERKKRAFSLLNQAGWSLHQGRWHHPQYGHMVLKLPMPNPIFKTIYGFFTQFYKKLGIEIAIQAMDNAQFIKTLHQENFDMAMSFLTRSSFTPGTELSALLSTTKSVEAGNVAGVKEAVVDKVVAGILRCKTYKELVLAAKVLDRIVTAGAYRLAGWGPKTLNVIYWQNKNEGGKMFKICSPDHSAHFMVDFSTWWAEPQKP